MWWYNILGYNWVIISHHLRICHISARSFLITADRVSLISKNTDPILTVKIIEWIKFNDYIGLSIEADPLRVVKKNLIFFILDI